MDKAALQRRIRTEQIDPTCSHPLYADFIRHIEETMPATSHYIRYFRTLAFALNHNVPLDRVVCDTGGSTLIQFLGNHAEKATYTKCDLRYGVDQPDESVDVFCSLEVIEHIKDQDSDKLSDIVLWNGSGVKAYVDGIYRALKPGALCLLTTPNPAGPTAILKALSGVSPSIYRPHVREFTKEELIQIFSAFQLVAYDAPFNFSLFDPEARLTRLRRDFTEDAAQKLKDVGDDHFFIFRKPAAGL